MDTGDKQASDRVDLWLQRFLGAEEWLLESMPLTTLVLGSVGIAVLALNPHWPITRVWILVAVVVLCIDGHHGYQREQRRLRQLREDLTSPPQEEDGFDDE